MHRCNCSPTFSFSLSTDQTQTHQTLRKAHVRVVFVKKRIYDTTTRRARMCRKHRIAQPTTMAPTLIRIYSFDKKMSVSYRYSLDLLLFLLYHAAFSAGVIASTSSSPLSS